MNPQPFAILGIIAIGAAVFGGIIWWGLSGTMPVSPPLPSGPVSVLPDILNLPGFANNQNKPDSQNVPVPPGTQTSDIVVQSSELPAPLVPPAPLPAQVPVPRISAPSRMTTQTTVPWATIGTYISPPSGGSSRPVSPSASLPQTTATGLSLPDVTPLGDFRTQMVNEGVIAATEFVRIRNNDDMEAFMLKFVEWQAKKAGSSDVQIQDAQNRVRKAYDQFR